MICTFNTALDNIDEALLRPGRLLARKEFIPLDKNSANRLLKHIGNEESADRDMSLAEIYSSSEQEVNHILTDKPKPKKKVLPVGFFNR